MSLDKTVRWSRRLDYVPRWSVVPTINKQRVSGHSYQVAQISRWLLPRHAFMRQGAEAIRGIIEQQDFALEVLALALDHDTHEAADGDAPTPSKAARDPYGVRQIEVLVKVADILEAIWFCEEEIIMGNSVRMQPIRTELHARLHPWWLAFQWNEIYGRKPITSDLINMLIRANMSEPYHPGMEPK